MHLRRVRSPYNGRAARFPGDHGTRPARERRSDAMEAEMEERTTTTRRTTVVPDEVDEAGSTNINIASNTGATTIQRNEPPSRDTVVRETTVEKTTRS